METQICVDCHKEKGIEEFRLWHSKKARNDFCVDCGKRRCQNWSINSQGGPKRRRKRPDRSISEIPDGYSESVVISDEMRAEIIRRIEG